MELLFLPFPAGILFFFFPFVLRGCRRPSSKKSLVFTFSSQRWKSWGLGFSSPLRKWGMESGTFPLFFQGGHH